MLCRASQDQRELQIGKRSSNGPGEHRMYQREASFGQIPWKMKRTRRKWKTLCILKQQATEQTGGYAVKTRLTGLMR
ncbi:hypothetical protein V5799_000608 [Amblyomma americanum]|uniref:Uncharacterized protein n=1 Tax=Amblyomma americanum TaxID=6943 RepID=A0AAQ4D2K2_AMBAM